MASTTMRWTLGNAAATAGSSSGTIHRPVVPMMPRRTVPPVSSVAEATSAESASSSAWMRRARATASSPAAVSSPVDRSTSRVPSSCSSRATWADTFDWTVCMARAAAEKLRWSATAVRAASWRRSIAGNDSRYRKEQLDRLLARVDHGAYNAEDEPISPKLAPRA